MMELRPLLFVDRILVRFKPSLWVSQDLDQVVVFP
jgi:hypothetical protein